MVKTMLKNFWQEEDGQDLVEYSLLLAFIAVAAVGLLTSANASIKSIWANVNSGLSKASAQK